MPRDGAIIFRDIVGKLVVLRGRVQVRPRGSIPPRSADRAVWHRCQMFDWCFIAQTSKGRFHSRHQRSANRIRVTHSFLHPLLHICYRQEGRLVKDRGPPSMQNVRKVIIEAIQLSRLPDDPRELFGELFSETEGTTTFPIQESLHWDYKNIFPLTWDGDYFGGILRLICAFYNTYGGVIVFGVDDTDRTIGHNKTAVDIERLNAILASWA
jgi:hypothetical protein